MSLNRNPDTELEDLLRVWYAELRHTHPEQRQAIVDALAGVRPAPESPISLIRVRWRRWTLAACSLVALLAIWSWRTSNRDGFAYGIEDVPQRLAEVQSLRIQGWQYIRWNDGKKKQPPLRVPLEIVIERPGKFRYTDAGITVQQGQKPAIRRSVKLCDGKHQWTLDGDNKLRRGRSVSRLDALLKTEEIAQDAARIAILGPPDADYRKIGKEEQNGNACDLYEVRFPAAGDTWIARVWIDPKDGLPVRVVRGQLSADGSLSPTIELTDIEVNAPLSDGLFRFQDSEDPKAADAKEQADLPVLDVTPTATGWGTDEHFDVWHSVRISDSAALVVWRRTAPAAKTDGRLDWLSGISMSAAGPHGMRELRHHWVYQSHLPDRWSWSLVVPVDGKPLNRDLVDLQMRLPQGLSTQALTPLRLGEQDLREVLRAAQKAMLPLNSAEISLPYLQAVASKLASGDSAP